eukprot:7878626-Pyramimonas_sp.AAC.1
MLRHLLKYRPESPFTVHGLRKALSAPRDPDMQRLKRCARYLKGTHDYGTLVTRSSDKDYLDTCSNADRAGDTRDRKSTSGCTLRFGGATLREFSEGQSYQALSSGESEYYAAVTSVAEAIHMQMRL